MRSRSRLCRRRLTGESEIDVVIQQETLRLEGQREQVYRARHTKMGAARERYTRASSTARVRADELRASQDLLRFRKELGYTADEIKFLGFEGGRDYSKSELEEVSCIVILTIANHVGISRIALCRQWGVASL
jgi:hypothetical protein